MAKTEQDRDIEHGGNIGELRAVAEVGRTRKQVAAVTQFFAEGRKRPQESQVAQRELPVGGGNVKHRGERRPPQVRGKRLNDEFRAERSEERRVGTECRSRWSTY